MGQKLGDFIALVRCGYLAAGLPGLVIMGCRNLGALRSAYEDVVAPIVERTISDLDERVEVGFALQAMSAKIGMVMLCYADLVGSEQRPEIAALAGAVTRLYDDLIDGSLQGSLDDRLSDLFNARPFSAHTELERLLAELVTEIRQRACPLPGETLDRAINTLHEYQCLSRQQREDSVPSVVLEKICRGKGAMANLVLCSLVKPHLDVAERELVATLGETLQSLDDYQDVELDKRNGVATLASLGVTTLADIGSRLCIIHSRLAARYGRRAARRYGGMIFFLLLKAVLGRRLPVFGRVIGKIAGRFPALVFLTRGTEALPAAPEGRGES
jgi:hypothetical protein